MTATYANAWRAADGSLRALTYPYRLVAEADAIPLAPVVLDRETLAEWEEIERQVVAERRERGA